MGGWLEGGLVGASKDGWVGVGIDTDGDSRNGDGDGTGGGAISPL